MEIFEKVNYSNYALWLGDNINKKIDIPTKNELALKIYSELNEDIKERIENKERLTEVSQLYLDSATGNMMNLISLLKGELELEGKSNPYTYLSEIDAIDTIITHDHSEILEDIWKDGEIHNIFCEKKVTKSNVNLFKILGDYGHTERIILTSQNMRKVKKLKLYDHFWEKLNGELREKNLILLGVNLDEDTKDILTLAFSKINFSNTARYYVTSTPVSDEDESWLISNGFGFIYEDDLNFLKKMALYFNDEKIDLVQVEKEVEITEVHENIQIIEVEDKDIFKENGLNIENKEENSIKLIFEEKVIEENEEIQLKMFEKEEVLVGDEKIDDLGTYEFSEEEEKLVNKEIFEVEEDLEFEKTEDDQIEDEYIVENLEIPLYLDGNILRGDIIETEVRNKQKRLVEFREGRSPSYKIDDFSEINHYRALGIKVPFERLDIPQIKLENKIFAGKVSVKCSDQTIYNVAVKSHMSGKYQVVDFKNHDFYLRLLLESDRVMKFDYKISENTVNIKGRNIYIFFKNLFSGFELNFKNKKTRGNFKIISDEDVEKLDIILDTIDKYLSIKKQIKIRDVNLKELLKNTRSLEVLFSYYNNTTKVTDGNITVRTNFTGDIFEVEKLVLSYPISINFLGFIKSFRESAEFNLDSSNITYVDNKLEVQAFNVVQNITYKEITE